MSEIWRYEMSEFDTSFELFNGLTKFEGRLNSLLADWEELLTQQWILTCIKVICYDTNCCFLDETLLLQW